METNQSNIISSTTRGSIIHMRPSTCRIISPRLYQKFVEPEQRLGCINHWNYDDPAIREARLAGPPPKPESKNILEMGGM